MVEDQIVFYFHFGKPFMRFFAHLKYRRKLQITGHGRVSIGLQDQAGALDLLHFLLLISFVDTDKEKLFVDSHFFNLRLDTSMRCGRWYRGASPLFSYKQTPTMSHADVIILKSADGTY